MTANTPKLNTEDEKLKKEAQEPLEQAEVLYQQIKDKTNKKYEETKIAGCDAYESIKEYSEDIIMHVREKPLASLLIAGGIGFILSSLLRK